MIEELKFYFKNTPREQILADWNKLANCDEVGPTVDEYLKANKFRYDLAELYGYIQCCVELEGDWIVKQRLNNKLVAIEILLDALPYGEPNPIDNFKQTIQ